MTGKGSHVDASECTQRKVKDFLCLTEGITTPEVYYAGVHVSQAFGVWWLKIKNAFRGMNQEYKVHYLEGEGTS